ncbi:neprilysin-2-like isoform X1 [Centruroides sculpturatus]|uniref:neprilysin-2-like isoform X1 n=1 Tax=Centruroides sculpturatus TaxID=218467 RepID=UPI000C6D467E|nr:neprilysin-2-like isoform X1 [Centruroides sculpturatus]
MKGRFRHFLYSFLLYFLSNSDVNFAREDSKICNSPECVFVAADLLTYMDHNVDPCKDFYSFACGRWEKSNPNITSVTTRLTEMNKNMHFRLKNLLESSDNSSEPNHWKKAKKFYRTCLNLDKREKLDKRLFINDIKQLGGWPVLENVNWKEDSFDWIQTLQMMFEMGYNKNILLKISIGADYKNTSIRRIFIDQPIFGMKKQLFFHEKYVDSYMKMIVEMVTLLKPRADVDNIAIEMASALDVERQLAQFALPIPNKRTPQESYNLVKIRQLMEFMPQIDWLRLLNAFLPDVILTLNDQVVVKEPKFLRQFGIFMKRLDKERRRDLANYMFYRVVIANAINLPKLFRWSYFDFRSELVNKEIHPPVWSLCIHATTTIFSYSASSIYAKKYFRKETKEAVKEMVRRIQERLICILKQVKWMDSTTRSRALEKAHAMSIVIGCSDDIFNDSQLNKHYEKIIIGNSHYENVQNARKYQYQKLMEGLNKPINKAILRGHTRILMANAYYSPFLNTMNIPVGILQDVIFNEHYPRYINYGRLGSIVGHEMTHAFDNKGAWYDKNGNWKLWWADDTYQKFMKTSECLVKQYNRFYITELHRKLNGTQTLGENIADNCGVRESYLAYRTWVSDHRISEPKLPGLDYTPNQLFWISYATGWCSSYSRNNLRSRVLYDVHPPARNRILATLSNSKDFAKDFNCPVESPLNPTTKCTVWI